MPEKRKLLPLAVLPVDRDIIRLEAAKRGITMYEIVSKLTKFIKKI